MNVLVIGGSGMLGSDLVSHLTERGHNVSAPSSRELDITNPESVAVVALDPGKYDWCVNCAAYTAVDKAESDVQAATELNQFAPGYLSNACSMSGIKLIHISTDFVFDGEAQEPYGVSSPTHPLSVYGRTKLEGELAVLRGNTNSLVVRTSWLFGANGRCFPKTMIQLWRAGKPLSVVSDQVGCPTSTVDLARVIVDMIDQNAYPGIYHACGPTACSWFDFAVESVSTWKRLHEDDRPVGIKPIPTSSYPTPAVRPKYSVMETSSLQSIEIQPMESLPESIRAFVNQLKLD